MHGKLLTSYFFRGNVSYYKASLQLEELHKPGIIAQTQICMSARWMCITSKWVYAKMLEFRPDTIGE